MVWLKVMFLFLPVCAMVHAYRFSVNQLIPLKKRPHATADTSSCVSGTGISKNVDSKDWKCACNPGYMNDNGNDKVCVDEDECSNGVALQDCPTTAGYCTNIPGSWTCACKDGYENLEGDTKKCVTASKFICKNGERISPLALCDSVSDCSDGSDEQPTPCRSTCNGDGKCARYYTNTTLLSWSDSQTECESQGGQLAVIKDADWNGHLANFTHFDYHPWIGLQLNNSEFRWVDGSIADSYTNFQNSPESYTEGQCFYILLVEGVWIGPDSCDYEWTYICEWP